ncbi:hypothetical protein TorRG33x02_210390 [Trema orientale]|uniref:Uncharacterized protein n=1 Tax=Trema orientale TaxID=63057 RepID=A0A2P5ECD1_TREOI|nr:hypothetical protein TorRG33x02_210390 [Trema orientale]
MDGDYNGSGDTINTVAEQHVIGIEPTTDEQKYLEKILREINTHSGDVQSKRDEYSKIRRYPQTFEERDMLRHVWPSELSIGPIHGRSSSMMHRELKFNLVAKFVKTFVKDQKWESLLGEIKQNIQDLKKYFDEEVIREYNEAELAWELFLDGCSVLQFIASYLLNELKEFGIDNRKASKIREDLFLLENQIPFRVLQLLVKSTSEPSELRYGIAVFLLINNIMAQVGGLYHHTVSDYAEGGLNLDLHPLHLLDFLHSVIIFGNEILSNFVRDDNDPPLRNQQKNMSCLCPPLFDCFRRRRPFLKDYLREELPVYSLKRFYFHERFFRGVRELKSSGIEFYPSDGLASVYFSGKCFNVRGHLRLPPLIVDEWTEQKLINLAIYEKWLSGNYKKNWYFVTSYIKFMDFLVDGEQDVEELRASRVLRNRLSNDAEVANLFNNLGSNPYFEPPEDVYSNVKAQLKTHCERKCSIWMAQVYQQHFSSPWTIIALLAAAVLLSLTIIQTWYTIRPKY